MNSETILNLVLAVFWSGWITYLIAKNRVNNIQFGIIGALLVFMLMMKVINA